MIWLGLYALAAALLIGLLNLLSVSRLTYYFSIHKITLPSTFSWVTGHPRLDAVLQGILVFIAAVILIRSGASFIVTMIGTSGIALSALFNLPLLAVTLASLLTITAVVQVGYVRRTFSQTLIFLLICIEVAALTSLFLKAASLDFPDFILNFESTLWHALGNLSPLAAVILLFYWLWFPALRFVSYSVGALRPKLLSNFPSLLAVNSSSKFPAVLRSANGTQSAAGLSWLLYPSSLILALLIALIPYLPTINPWQMPVSVDAYYNAIFLEKMIKGGPSAAFYIAGGDRPVHLLLMYYLQVLSGWSAEAIAKYHNIILLPLLPISIYYLAKEWFGRETALIAMTLTPLSPMFLTFLIGGFQANNMALILLFIVLGLLSKPTRNRTTAAIALQALAIFIHPWSWDQLVVSMALFYVISLSKSHQNLGNQKNMLIFLIGVAGTIAFRSFLLPESIGALESANIVASGLSLLNVVSFPQHLSFSLNYFVWGAIANTPLYLLALRGALKAPFNPIISLLVVSAPLTLFADSGLIIRLITNIPIQVLAGYTLANWLKTGRRLVVVFVVLFLMTHAVRFAVNAV